VVAPDTYVQGAYAGSAFEIKSASLADYTVQSNCWLGASAGGVVSNATVADGGKLCAFEGGVAIAPTVDVGGVLYLYEGGSSYEIRENGGAVFGEVTENVSFASNTFSGAVLGDWREATVHSGTTATDTTINADGGLYVFDGGVVSATIVNSEGVLALHEGGVASSATVNVGGEIRVSSGGMAHQIRENGGYVEIEDGANVSFVSNTISGLTLNEYDFATVHSGTTATDVSVNSECELEVFSGGIVGDVAVNADGALSVYDGGIAIVVTVNEKGVLEVAGGGTANDVTVNGGGAAEVSSGVIDGTVVNSGGSLLIYSGAKLTGRMTFESGAEVIPFVGSILDFDLTQTSAGADALVNDLSILMGKPSYTLTVDGNESDGAYKLAGGAAGFNETITVLNFFGEELGTLAVGADLDIDGKIYTLTLNDSDLSITIDPSNTPDDGTNDLLYDKKNETWNDANITVENWISASSLDVDDTVYLDVPGSIGKHVNNIVMHNMVGYNTPDPDTGDTARIFVDDPAKLTFQIDSTVAGTFYVYEKVYDKKKGAYKQVQVGKVSVTKNKSAYLKNICVTGDGDYFVQMAANSSAYKKEDATGYYNVTVASAEFFDDVDNGWNDSYASALVQMEPVSIGRATSFVALDDNVESADDWNFVGGISDAADFARIRLDSSAFLSFNVIGDNGDGSAKFTIWKFNGTKGLKKVTSVTLKNGKYEKTTKGVFLDKDGEYYISMESTDAAKGKALYYKVEVNTLGTRFFDSADDNRNNVLYDKKRKEVYGEDKTHHFVVNNVSAGSPAFSLDDNEIGLEGFENFVGYGDKVDYAKFTVAEEGKLTFTVTATEGATFEVWTLKNGKMKSLGKTKLKLGNNATASTCSGTVSNLSLEVGTEYYVSMTAAKTTANTKGSVFYNVTATLVPQNDSSLSMPETDVLADASVGACLDSASDKLFGETGNGLLASL
jgi:autotransporter passenger strand-loop-strand repeat protein